MRQIYWDQCVIRRMPEACEGAIRYMPFTMVRTDDGTYVYGATHLDLSDGNASQPTTCGSARTLTIGKCACNDGHSTAIIIGSEGYYELPVIS